LGGLLNKIVDATKHVESGVIKVTREKERYLTHRNTIPFLQSLAKRIFDPKSDDAILGFEAVNFEKQSKWVPERQVEVEFTPLVFCAKRFILEAGFSFNFAPAAPNQGVLFGNRLLRFSEKLAKGRNNELEEYMAFAKAAEDLASTLRWMPASDAFLGNLWDFISSFVVKQPVGIRYVFGLSESFCKGEMVICPRYRLAVFVVVLSVWASVFRYAALGQYKMDSFSMDGAPYIFLSRDHFYRAFLRSIQSLPKIHYRIFKN